jgi:hypothetical protein
VKIVNINDELVYISAQKRYLPHRALQLLAIFFIYHHFFKSCVVRDFVLLEEFLSNLECSKAVVHKFYQLSPKELLKHTARVPDSVGLR